jgi:hypothetical protein
VFQGLAPIFNQNFKNTKIKFGKLEKYEKPEKPIYNLGKIKFSILKLLYKCFNRITLERIIMNEFFRDII